MKGAVRLAALALVWVGGPQVALADAISVAIVQDNDSRASQLGLTSSYATVARELERTLLLQNVSVTSLKAEAPLPVTSKSTLVNDKKFDGQDYGIVYSIAPAITENSIARLLSVTASGDVYEVQSGRRVTSFSVVAPETIPLPRDDADCNSTCVENEIAALSDDLARELSFVLTQKLHFLREDQGLVDTSDTAAIAGRLTGREDQPQFVETIGTGAGDYKVDKARALDVDVYFDLNSAVLTETAKAQLEPLGRALTGVALGQSRYLVAGHTDASGSANYNRQLSERRAKAVRQYLLQQFAIEPNRLVAIGLGEDHLRTPVEPYAALNRRVEIVAIVAGPQRADPIGGPYDYTLTFDLLPRDKVLQLVRQLEASTVDEIELLKSSTTQRVYSVRTNLALMNFEEKVMLALMDQGLDLNRLRIASSGTNLQITTLD